MKPSVCRLAAILLALTAAFAQQKFTVDDYARAEKLMGYNTTAEGAEFVLVDPAKGTRVPAFDHVKLAAALSAATGRTYAAGNLPFQEIEFSADGQRSEEHTS